MEKLEEPATIAQKLALMNKAEKFGFNYIEPITKRDAQAQFKRLDSLIAQKKMGLGDDAENDHMFFESHDSGDWLDPIY